MIRCFVLFLPCLLCLGAAPAEPGLTAEKWLNQLTIRRADTRSYLILFFDSEDSRELKEQVERLNKLARRRDVLVQGATPERERAARKFIARYRPRFAVGVQSTSHQRFDVKRFPAVVVIKDETRQSVNDWGMLDELLGPAPDGALDPEEMTVDELQTRVEQQGGYRLLDMLRIRMEPQEFLAYCNELERKSPPGTWLGNLDYLRHLADPQVAEKQPPTTPAIDAIRQAKQKGLRKTSEWERLLKTKESWTHDEILELYFRNWGEDPEDLVYRADLATALESTNDPRYADPLLDMLETEPDPGIRLKIILAISGIHDDVSAFAPQVIERLEAHLLVEDNIRWARSALEGLLKEIHAVKGDSGTAP